MRARHSLGSLACGLLAAGCGIGALAPDATMPTEQRASLIFERVVLFPLTVGTSEVAVAVNEIQAARRESALGAPGGFQAGADRGAAEVAYQDQIGGALDRDDPFTRFVLAARLWLAGEVDAGRVAPAAALEVLAQIRAEVQVLRARRENFRPAALHLRRTLWAATQGTSLEGLQRETEVYHRYRLDCPSERAWGSVDSAC